MVSIVHEDRRGVTPDEKKGGAVGAAGCRCRTARVYKLGATVECLAKNTRFTLRKHPILGRPFPGNGTIHALRHLSD